MNPLDLKHLFPLRDRTLPALLDRQVKRYGERPLFVADGVRWSYADVQRETAAYAGRLGRSGIAAGDRVALICGNRPEFLGLFLGCAWMGAISVPINTASRGFQLQHILRNSGAKLLAIEAEYLSALDTIDLGATDLKRIWVIDAAGPLPDCSGVPVCPLPPAGDLRPSADNLLPGDTLTIIYTSGTTGMSKGVCCPHAQYFAWGLYAGRQLGLVEGDILHTTLPLFHTNALGCFFQALLYGGTQVVEKRFSVTQFWDRLIASRATVTFILGAMAPMLMSRPVQAGERNHSVRVALAPGVSGKLQEAFSQRTGIGIIDAYGATETNAVIGCDLTTRRDGYMGQVQADFEARVVDENDQELPDGEAGELVLRASEPFAFSTGYFGMPEKTIEAWRNLWFHTGDRVICDDGYFRFIDRLKDAIRRRGENISSYEVEQVLLSHPAVETAAVYAVSSDLAEDEVMAALVLREGAQATPEEIVRFCEGKMSYFAIPRYVDLLDAIPRTENGKIKKFEMRTRGITPTSWDRERAGVTIKR
jgi:crotonobetaine/carnitine-CoA ligase